MTITHYSLLLQLSAFAFKRATHRTSDGAALQLRIRPRRQQQAHQVLGPPLVCSAATREKHVASQRTRAHRQDFAGAILIFIVFVIRSLAHVQRTCTVASCNLRTAGAMPRPLFPVGMKRSRDEDDGSARAVASDCAELTATQLPRHATAAASGAAGSDYDDDASFSHVDTLTSPPPPPPDLRSPARRATSEYRLFFIKKATTRSSQFLTLCVLFFSEVHATVDGHPCIVQPDVNQVRARNYARQHPHVIVCAHACIMTMAVVVSCF